MTNVITADFNGTNVLFKNDGYLNATSIAKGFGKQPKDYLKTEQTKAYIKALAKNISTRTKILVKENQLVSVKNGGDDRGTWLHPKLAVHFARWLSAEFAVWCDEQIENILHGEQPKPKIKSKKQLSTSISRIPLVDIVHEWSVAKKRITSDCWIDLHEKYGVENIRYLTDEQVKEAIEYVQVEVLEGELMPRDEQKYITDDKNLRLAGIALMTAGTNAKARQDRIIEKLEDLLSDARHLINEHNFYNGAVHDGLREAKFKFGFKSDEIREGRQIGDDSFNRRFG